MFIIIFESTQSISNWKYHNKAESTIFCSKQMFMIVEFNVIPTLEGTYVLWNSTKQVRPKKQIIACGQSEPSIKWMFHYSC